MHGDREDVGIPGFGKLHVAAFLSSESPARSLESLYDAGGLEVVKS